MKIPKYVAAFVENDRLALAPYEEQCAKGGEYGYVWRLYRLSNVQYPETLEDEARRLAAWARREYADAAVLSHYDADLKRQVILHWFPEKLHRKPYYKRDYVLVSMTDPVSLRLEKMIEARRKRK